MIKYLPKYLSIGLLTFSVALGLHACGDKKETETKDTEKEANHIKHQPDIGYTDEGASLLYEITGNGLSQPSYLYGTIHVISEDLFSTSNKIEGILANSDYLVMEVENITQLSAMGSVMGSLRLDSGTVSDYVSDSLYSAFIEALEEHTHFTQATFEQQFATMKPFGLYTIVASAGGESTGKTKSYELYFMDLAYENNLQVAGLETLEDQMAVFGKVTMEDMLVYIIETLNNQDASAGSELEKLGKIYASMRLDSISSYLLKGDDMLMTKYKNEFLDQRNSNWIPIIEDLSRKHSCFIAVGAAHLSGETGVIQLLRELGYTLKAVSID